MLCFKARAQHRPTRSKDCFNFVWLVHDLERKIDSAKTGPQKRKTSTARLVLLWSRLCVINFPLNSIMLMLVKIYGKTSRSVAVLTFFNEQMSF